MLIYILWLQFFHLPSPFLLVLPPVFFRASPYLHIKLATRGRGTSKRLQEDDFDRQHRADHLRRQLPTSNRLILLVPPPFSPIVGAGESRDEGLSDAIVGWGV